MQGEEMRRFLSSQVSAYIALFPGAGCTGTPNHLQQSGSVPFSGRMGEDMPRVRVWDEGHFFPLKCVPTTAQLLTSII